MYKYFKRAVDFICSFIAVIILSPLFLITAVAIKIDSEGPVLFRQIRTGLDGMPFTLYKFRTMVADNDVHDFSSGDVHTKVGSFLRKTSLDEFAQFLNVLNGTMSFIGPRPWIPDYYESMNEEQRHRCDVRPGITGLAQVKGRNNITIFQKIEYDLEYINNFSLLEDIKVILLTIKAVLTKEGADAGKNTIQTELQILKEQGEPETEIIFEELPVGVKSRPAKVKEYHNV